MSEGRGTCLPRPPPASGKVAVQHGAHQQGRGGAGGGHKLIGNPVIEEGQPQTVTRRVGAQPHSFAGFPCKIQNETQVLKALAEPRKASIHLTGPGRGPVDGRLRGRGGSGGRRRARERKWCWDR